MLVMRNNKILFDVAGETNAGGGGGAGAGSLLNTSARGGGSAPPAGDPNPAPGANQNNAPAGNTPPSGAATPPANFDWKSTLPPEVRENPSIKLFNDLPSMAKSLISAQAMIGADKIVVPGKNSTEEDWKGVYKKLGLPDDPKQYEVKFKDGITIDKDFSENFKLKAHAAGILPKQAQALADWFGEENAQAEEKVMAELKAQNEAEIGKLKTEWGAAFDKKLAGAQQVVNEIGNEEFDAYLTEKGLLSDPKFVKFLSSIKEKFLTEDTEVGGKNPNDPSLTPADAKRDHAAIMANMDHPYWKKDHPGHKAAVDEVSNLMKMMNPAQKSR